MVMRPYESPSGLHFARLYPVEGDSAIAEIWRDDEIIGQLTLRDIHLDATGEARTDGAAVEFAIYPARDAEWTVALDDFLAVIDAARVWLIENEQGRTPIDEDGITAAGAAIDKISDGDPLWRPPSDDSN